MRILVAVLFLTGAAPAAVAVQDLPAVVEEARQSGHIRVDGTRISVPTSVIALYERAGYRPFWSEPTDVRELAAFIGGVVRDGLDPADYSHALLRELNTTAERSARLDVVRTTALVRVARHLRSGRVDEQTLRPNDDWPATSLPELERLLPPYGSRAAWDALRPSNFVYDGLTDALADLRHIEATGGWPHVPAGPSLRLGDIDERVAVLRTRLARSGDLAVDSRSREFDAALDTAVRRFQHRHGLNEDGVVGPATLAQLNVPVAQRIAQIRINLERARWISPRLGQEFVAVNAAGALVYMVRDGDVVFEARAVTGAAHTRTPVFTAEMQTIELNPTWTVPPGIVGEVLAAIRRNPRYLRDNDMRVIDARGRVIDADGIDFGRYNARTFPYIFRQQPGPSNPLGRIKFVFPNRFNVYLHDTPQRHLFERDQRLFSHGCIRVQEPLRLAELVLDDPEWTRPALESAIATGETRVIRLHRPIPVLVLYWTASADRHGELHFYRDVYGRDGALLAALDAA